MFLALFIPINRTVLFLNQNFPAISIFPLFSLRKIMGVQPTNTTSCTLHLPIMDQSIEDPYPYLSQAKATSRIPQCLSAGRCHTSGPLSIHENPFQRTIIHCPVLAITAAAITGIESSRIAIGMTVTKMTLICSRPIARMKEQIRWTDEDK